MNEERQAITTYDNDRDADEEIHDDSHDECFKL